MPSAESTKVDSWALLDEIPGAICVLDGAGLIRYKNQVFRRILTPAAAEAAEVGADFFGRLLPLLGAGEDIAALARAVRAALGGRRGQVVELSFQGAAGLTRLAARLKPLPAGDRRVVMLHFSDITADKATEEALRKNEQRLNHHFILSPLGIIEWNTRFECTDWNPAAEKIFGVSRGEALGKSAVGFIYSEERRTIASRSWAELLKTGRGSRHVDEYRRKDGSIVICEWYDTSFEDHEGNVVGVTSLVQDITERRTALELLRRSLVAQGQKADLAEREAREKDRLVRELDQKLAIIAEQHRQIVALSMPILELWDDVLAVPIIGEMDAQRSAFIMERLLPAIVAKRARYVILDLTSVKEVDQAAAEHLAQVIQAVRLLGATGVLTGIRPAVAGTIVALGADLSTIATFRSLREGLKACGRPRVGVRP